MAQPMTDQRGNLDAGPPWEDTGNGDLDPAAERAIRAAGLAWHDEAEAERQLALAVSIAPDHMSVLVAHYRYNFYKHRYRLAAVYAERILVESARRLAIPADWKDVRQEHADFRSNDPNIRFWLFVLQAYGYLLLRLDRRDEGNAVLQTLAKIDVADQTKTAVLLQVIERSGSDD